jgi:hypothetical protein
VAAVWTLLPPAAFLAAQTAPSEPDGIPITDRYVLEELGLAPDAANVYATPDALRRMAMHPEERRVLQDELLERETLRRVDSRSFGVASLGTTVVGYPEFQPAYALETLQPRNNYSPDNGLACNGGTHSYEAQIAPIPAGAALDYVNVYLHDSSSGENITAWLYRICQISSSFEPTVTLVDSLSTTGAPGDTGFLLDADGITASDFCVYTVRVRLDSGGSLVFDCSEGNDLRLYKARAVWQRQVSPAPLTATFDDVPTDHPLFQYVEAVANAGITYGCPDPDKFCPNEVITRAQIAELLARALGLHWGIPLL